MSLDVSLCNPNPVELLCNCCGSLYKDTEYYYTANITHNLGEMADRVGLYNSLWHPAELFPKQKENVKAHQLISHLQAGLTKLNSQPDFAKQFNPPNGWGNYDNLIEFTELYLQACQQWPDAVVKVSR